jgi:hypothetical protein
MKLIPKILGLAIGIAIAFCVTAYWDDRHADIVCDQAQAPDQSCQQRFIRLDRQKNIVDINERRHAR